MGSPVNIALAVFVGAVATLVIHAKGRSKEQLVYNLIPRFFLLQAFYEMQPRLPFLYTGEEWKRFYERIKRVLEDIQRDILGTRENDTRGSIKRVSIAVDRHLVSYLQSQKQLAQLLHEYLPASGQSWAAFLSRDSLQQDPDLSFPEIQSETEEKRLETLENMKMLVSSFLYDLQQIDSSIVEAKRGKENITAAIKLAPTTYELIKVFYATDRGVTEDAQYTCTRSDRNGLHYGHMVVGIPTSHKKGDKGSPEKHVEADPVKHIVILSINTELRSFKSRFVKQLDEELERVDCENAVLLFIHGYNVRHNDAIKSAAQLKHDLEFKGVTIAYTWSSKGHLGGYIHDERQIESTVTCLEEFIITIMNKIQNGPDVHIVAHSMGNRALIRALHNIQNQIQNQNQVPRSVETTMTRLKNVVFAAADESRQTFDNMVRAFQQSSCSNPLLTVYSSKNDKALFASRFVHNLEHRLGDTRSFLKAESQERGSDLIDVSGPDITLAWLHHSYYGRIPEVLQDIGFILRDNWDAESRSSTSKPLIKCVTYRKKVFYAFRESEWSRQQTEADQVS